MPQRRLSEQRSEEVPNKGNGKCKGPEEFRKSKRVKGHWSTGVGTKRRESPGGGPRTYGSYGRGEVIGLAMGKFSAEI